MNDERKRDASPRECKAVAELAELMRKTGASILPEVAYILQPEAADAWESEPCWDSSGDVHYARLASLRSGGAWDGNDWATHGSVDIHIWWQPATDDWWVDWAELRSVGLVKFPSGSKGIDAGPLLEEEMQAVREAVDAQRRWWEQQKKEAHSEA